MSYLKSTASLMFKNVIAILKKKDLERRLNSQVLQSC